jgi:hypothetical protein
MHPVPAGCTPGVVVRSDWLQKLTSTDPESIRLSVTANPSPELRLATVMVADKIFVVQQAGAETPGLSVVPGKLVFGLRPHRSPYPRRIAIQADDPNATITVAATAPWIRTKPVKRKTREYDVRIDTAAIPPGRLREAAVRVSAGAAVVDVPVIVERTETR